MASTSDRSPQRQELGSSRPKQRKPSAPSYAKEMEKALKVNSEELVRTALRESATISSKYISFAPVWRVKSKKEQKDRGLEFPDKLDEIVRDGVSIGNELDSFQSRLRNEPKYRKEMEVKVRILEQDLIKLLHDFLEAIKHVKSVEEVQAWKGYEKAEDHRKQIYDFIKFTHTRSKGMVRIQGHLRDARLAQHMSTLELGSKATKSAVASQVRTSPGSQSGDSLQETPRKGPQVIPKGTPGPR